MARFSQKAKDSSKTLNKEAAPAYSLNPKLDLYSKVCTASLQPKFYEKNTNTQLQEIRNLILQVPVDFTASLAAYARERLYLRSIPVVLTVELASISNSPIVGRLTERIIQRADEIQEVLSYYALRNAPNAKGQKRLRKLDKQIQRGVARAFAKFDEYQFAKYNRDTEIRLRDAMFLCHPKPPEGKEELYKKIASDSLETPFTWETELSSGKGTKKEIWERLIASKKVGYMATLRNLRNILEAGVSGESLHSVLQFISNRDSVLASKQLPFRFFSAYREIQDVIRRGSSSVLDALEKAASAAASNIEGFDDNETVLIACDTSGSMQHPLTQKSKIQNYEVGIVLGAWLRSKCKEAVTGIFADSWRPVSLSSISILANVDSLSRLVGSVGHSTNGHKVIDWALKNRIEFSKFLFFTDCQWWNTEEFYFSAREDASSAEESWRAYKKLFPAAKAYYFDLQGYGTTPIKIGRDGVYFIAGWNEEVFKILSALDRGSSAVEEIEKIKV